MQSLMLKINISSVNQALHAHSGSHALFKRILQFNTTPGCSVIFGIAVEWGFESWNSLFRSQIGYYFSLTNSVYISYYIETCL